MEITEPNVPNAITKKGTEQILICLLITDKIMPKHSKQTEIICQKVLFIYKIFLFYTKI